MKTQDPGHVNGAPDARPRPCRVEDAIAAQPDWLRAEIEALKKHEAVVLRALEDAANRELYLRDPAALLGKLKVPVSGALKARLRTAAEGSASPPSLSIRLPNGQTLSPRVKVRFVKERR